jgi:diguanylate cyclase (GGDEF)-like protein
LTTYTKVRSGQNREAVQNGNSGSSQRFPRLFLKSFPRKPSLGTYPATRSHIITPGIIVKLIVADAGLESPCGRLSQTQVRKVRFRVDLWNKATVKSLVIPGAALLLVAALLLSNGILSLSAPAIDFYYYAVFGVGVLLAWRFHSSRVLFALVFLLLAHRAIEFFSAGRLVANGPGRIAFEAVAFLLPLNFVVLSFLRERGLGISAIASRLAILFFESVFVALICRTGEITGPSFLHFSLLSRHLLGWTRIPQPAWIVFILASGILVTRFLLYRKPVESGLLWSLAAVVLGLQAGGLGKIGSAYFATAGLILVSSIIENSYVLAYHDELTGLPSRRAYNERLLTLERPYTVAVVDIDHFKNFNDTYGHDTGDQVLRMVAGRLAEVNGGGKAFRVGGEEFFILFPGKMMKDVVEHLELLRGIVEGSTFRVRGVPDRRHTPPRAADRRTPARRKTARSRNVPAAPGDALLSVTISIGVAEPNAKLREVEQVIIAADKALYKAKHAGRNRVETATASRTRAGTRRNIA